MSQQQRVCHALFLFLIAGCGRTATQTMNAAASAGITAADAAGTGGTAAGAAGSAQASMPTMPTKSVPTMPTMPTMDDGMPTFTNIFTFDFRSCRVMTCHGGGLAGLNMSSQDYAWSSLVNQPPNPERLCAQIGKQRVVPNDPDNSLLCLKLEDSAPCGQPMPPGGQLSRAARARIRMWIEMGAENN